MSESHYQLMLFILRHFLVVGYYPPSETVEYTEDSPPSSAGDPLTSLCNDWENSAKLPDDCKTRLVTMRIGVVLGRNGGVIQQTIWPFWLGIGGTVFSSFGECLWLLFSSHLFLLPQLMGKKDSDYKAMHHCPSYIWQIID